MIEIGAHVSKGVGRIYKGCSPALSAARIMSPEVTATTPRRHAQDETIFFKSVEETRWLFRQRCELVLRRQEQNRAFTCQLVLGGQSLAESALPTGWRAGDHQPGRYLPAFQPPCKPNPTQLRGEARQQQTNQEHARQHG